MWRVMVVGSLLVVVVLLTGCGGSPSSSPVAPPGAARTVTLGPLQVAVASAAGLKTLALPGPPTSPVNLTVLYGSKIVRLAEMGYGKIAFVSARDGNCEIYVMNADGSGQARLTSNATDDLWPAWSPDGRKIAFQTYRDGNHEIYVMNADGSGQTRLTSNQALDCVPAWSPDGRKIAFTSFRDGNGQVYVMNADGAGQTRLTNNATDDLSPAWSPNGREIAFAGYRDGDPEIYVMNADGSGQTRLTNNATDDLSPAWSPNGREIAFHTYRDGNWEIYVMNTDGSRQTRLTDDLAVDQRPAWSPDGRKIAFYSDRNGSDEIYAMNADGAGQTNLTNHSGDDLTPAWGPAPSVDRTFIGAAGSDGGSNPPFGLSRPLAVVGLTDAEGVVSATTLSTPSRSWASLQVEALDYGGGSLTGLKITGTQLGALLEDMGRGLPARKWDVTGSPPTVAVVVFFSGTTGRIRSLLASSDSTIGTTAAGREKTAEVVGGRLIVHGRFAAAYDARDPSRNRLHQRARQVTLDARTGQVVSAQ